MSNRFKNLFGTDWEAEALKPEHAERRARNSELLGQAQNEFELNRDAKEQDMTETNRLLSEGVDRGTIRDLRREKALAQQNGEPLSPTPAFPGQDLMDLGPGNSTNPDDMFSSAMLPRPEVDPEPLPEAIEAPLEPLPDEPRPSSRFSNLRQSEPIVEPQMAPEVPAKDTQVMDDLTAAQAERRKQLENVQSRRAFNNLTAAITGRTAEDRKAIGADTPYMQGQMALADLEVDDVEQKRKAIRSETQHSLEKLNLEKSQAANDPNSEISKAYREAALRQTPDVNKEALAKLSANEMQSVYGVLKDEIEFKNKKQELAIARELKESADNEKRTNVLFDKTIHYTTPLKSLRGNPGAWKNSRVMASRIRNMLPKEGSDEMSKLVTKESIGALAQMIKGGVATDSQVKALEPATLRKKMEDALAYVQSNPLPNYKKLKPFIDEVRKFSNAMDATYGDAAVESAGQLLRQHRELGRRDPRKFRDVIEPLGFRMVYTEDGDVDVVEDMDALNSQYNAWARTHAPLALQFETSTTPAHRGKSPGGASESTKSPPPGTVLMQGPKGDKRHIPKDQVEAAIRAGGKVL